MKNHKSNSPHLGVKLEAEMKRLKLKPPAVAELFGVAVPSVYDWISSGRIAKKHYPKLVKVFGRPLAWWFDMNEVTPGPLVARDNDAYATLRADEAQLLDLYNFMTESDRHDLLTKLADRRRQYDMIFDEIMRRRQSSPLKL